MPLTGPASYGPMTEQMLAHWRLADERLGPGHEIVLLDGVTLAVLEAKLVLLLARRDVARQCLVFKGLTRVDIELREVAILLRLGQFCEKVRAYFPRSKWVAGLPRLPYFTDAPAKVLGALDEAAYLWGLINAAPDTASPVILLGGYTLEAFGVELTGLRTAVATLRTCEVDLAVARADRNLVQDEIRPILKNYRAALPTHVREGHALLKTLPRLTPLPGSTPAAVEVTIVWDSEREQAKIVWTENPNSHIEAYELRFCPGPDYSGDDETTIASVPPDAPREVFTDAGLTAPGSVASFKVYVVTDTGHEKGSKAVSLQRPE
ncbi:MAG: hypothetical protein AABP62_22990 [Planctomycetota bacterium]